MDILRRRLYEKKLDIHGRDSSEKVWSLTEYASTIALDRARNDIIWMVTDRSFGWFNLNKGIYNALLLLDLEPGQRANDGAVSPAGDFYFGSMAWQPQEGEGNIYSISADAGLTKHGIQNAIPNTFCWNQAGTNMLISDSLQQEIYSYKLRQGHIVSESRTLFSNISKRHGVPDGGAMDIEGNLLNARWDGHKVLKFSQTGIVLDEITLPVPKPSSCCFGGINNQQLFITTACLDMNEEELERYPQSGQVFIVDQDAPGAPVFPFGMDT